MTKKGFCVKVQLDIHAVTCPGVWLCPNGKVAIQINALDCQIESRKIDPVFPLLFHDKLTFKKVFTGASTLVELQHDLEEEFFYAELIQWAKCSTQGVILATFQANLADLLYPTSCSKGLLPGVDIDLLMEPTKYFPGIIAPKIEISTKTCVEEVVGLFKNNEAKVHIINPKTINSKGTSLHRKRPIKGIIRQRKVCHTQGRHRAQSCQPYRQRSTSAHSSRCHHRRSSNQRAQLEECYHSEKKNCMCNCRCSRLQCKAEVVAVNNNLHVLENCPVCLRYNCYFPNEFNSTMKNIDVKRKESSLKNEDSCKCIYKSIHNQFIDNHRPSSAPSVQEEFSISLLKSRMKDLRDGQEKLSRSEDTSNYDFSFPHSHTPARKGFYKNLEKFYKRMYEQAKIRAKEVDM